jgi:hypothetical protein
MKITDEDRKYILSEFLRNISHISDHEYQIRVWIQGEGPEVNDFDETVCHFFDDGDPILKNYKEYGITDSQYRLLMEFRDQFKSFSDEHDLPEEFIDTAEWKRIMEKARDVINAFNYPGKNPE